MSIISELISKNRAKQVKVGVFGDCGIDEYHNVQVKRISPEAPVPVMLTSSEEASYILPGMAANVAYQFRKWNVDCTLFGLMSNIDAAVYERHGINLPKHYAGEWLTKRVPRKIRYQDQQTLIRWDIEDGNYGNEVDISNLILCLDYYLENEGLDIVILSDYNKGTFQNISQTKEIINTCKKYGVKTIVDPKNEPIEKWCGCTYFKPNSSEAERFSEGKGYKRISDRLPNSHIVVTHGNGVKIYGCGLEFEYNCVEDVKVSNYSGAGDCFAATFALAVAHKFPLKDCMEIAYKAGQKYVQSHHNKPVAPLDLYDTKFVHPKDLKNRDFKLVVTNGIFDLFHFGHLQSLKFAKSKGDKLAVLINSDESARRLKGESRPIIPLKQRMEVIAALECVDYVISFEKNDSPGEYIKLMAPDVLVKGASYDVDQISSKEFVNELYLCPLIDGVSTSNIVKKIKNG